MQRRNLVVKSVTAFVEAAQALRQRAVDESPINVLTISRRRSRACLFQQVDQPSGIAIGKTATVPVGRYTQEVLEAAGLWSALAPKFVQADTVRQVLDYVSRGEADAGFVYRTDAAIAGDKVRILLTAQGHTPVTYPIVVVSDSRQKALARDFIAFLATPPAVEVLARYGFGAP